MTFATVMRKATVADAPPLSVAVTSAQTAPTSSLVGVPANVRVSTSKASHVGSASPEKEKRADDPQDQHNQPVSPDREPKAIVGIQDIPVEEKDQCVAKVRPVVLGGE